MAWKTHPRAVLATLLLIHILAHIDRNILLGFSAQMTADLALTNAQYGFLVGAVWVFSFGFMAVVMGTLADRFSRTRVIAAGLLIWSVCTGASGLAHNFSELVAARFLVASGEAALVPAAVALLAELFDEKRRGTALGLFFMGIPLGVGLSFLLSGTFGATHGWRDTFYALGVAGTVMAVLVGCLKETRAPGKTTAAGTPFLAQLRAVMGVLRANPMLCLIMAGIVLAHMVFAGLAFTQLWLVRERGLDAAGIARTIGLLQIVFGTLGSVAGGIIGDRYAQRLPGGHAAFMALLVALCAPLMIAYRFAAPGSVLFYAGMCAGFFLPLALYGPANTLIMQQVPEQMRSTISGVSMLLINVFAIALGNLAVGALSDRLLAAGMNAPLRTVLLMTDGLAISSLLCFLSAARRTGGVASVRPQPL